MAGLPDTGGNLGGAGGPPPSTLAAQLVENISASSRSARSDDNAELKGLFAVIQRVKDQPSLLRTAAQRTEHNHMLVYVYCRVVLDAARLDDDHPPLLDAARHRGEALKALTFLRFTVNETPAVLCHASATHGLLFRGPEPLWAQASMSIGEFRTTPLRASTTLPARTARSGGYVHSEIPTITGSLTSSTPGTCRSRSAASTASA